MVDHNGRTFLLTFSVEQDTNRFKPRHKWPAFSWTFKTDFGQRSGSAALWLLTGFHFHLSHSPSLPSEVRGRSFLVTPGGFLPSTVPLAVSQMFQHLSRPSATDASADCLFHTCLFLQRKKTPAAAATTTRTQAITIPAMQPAEQLLSDGPKQKARHVVGQKTIFRQE